ncbi:POP5 [Candida oxycetoniae]|uniref:Ribonuclease P/MRP protein subunit POP5 n=1 Tax=Candida oxycetoniae TaxID=497107 RepID=A0AAI9T256_9ASCO|nr:POP5 [Candida oxycetoniae]KAI3406720.2 POP5 [Candida oxycetoniae]
MVRVKHRYILFDILYPPSISSNEQESYDFTSSQQRSLLTLHQSSSPEITQKTILQGIRKSLYVHFGDIGSGSAGMLMSVRYFSNTTSTGIIRCDRDQVSTIVAAMSLITRLNANEPDVIMRCLHISGTIKKCEEFSIRSSRELMNKLGQARAKEMNDFLQEVGELSEDEEEE